MRCTAELLDKRSPIQGPGVDSEEKRAPVSDIDTAVADSLKVLDLKWPIREADMLNASAYFGSGPILLKKPSPPSGSNF